MSGIKRHITVDTQGLPHAIGVTTANVTDRKGALTALSVYQEDVTQVQGVLGDTGYSGQPFADGVRELIGSEVQMAKRSALHPFKVIPKRRVVERSFAGVEKCQRLWKNCAPNLQSSLAMVALAFIALLLI